ncbi:MAG: AhpC/TSA family protein [Deltaproteobacteria bacterium]|nr:AhpC/TSA family protein [Deltaproteobacteria bacterium]
MKLGAQVVLVELRPPAESRAFAAKYDVPFPLVSDPAKMVYRKFDLRRMTPWGFLAPEVVLKGVSAMARGHHMGLPQGAVRQLPGVFVITTAGRNRFQSLRRQPGRPPGSCDDPRCTESGPASRRSVKTIEWSSLPRSYRDCRPGGTRRGKKQLNQRESASTEGAVK